MDFYHGFNTSKNHYLEKQILDLFHSLSVPGNTHPNFDELYYRKIFEQSDSSKMYYIYTINYICLFDYLFISSQMSAKPYFIGSTGIFLLW